RLDVADAAPLRLSLPARPSAIRRDPARAGRAVRQPAPSARERLALAPPRPGVALVPASVSVDRARRRRAAVAQAAERRRSHRPRARRPVRDLLQPARALR